MPSWGSFKKLFSKNSHKNDHHYDMLAEQTNNAPFRLKKTPKVQQKKQSTYAFLDDIYSQPTPPPKARAKTKKKSYIKKTKNSKKVENGNPVDLLNMPYSNGAGPPLSILPVIVSNLNYMEENYTEDDPEIIGIFQNSRVEYQELSTRRFPPMTFYKSSNGNTNVFNYPKARRPATPYVKLSEMNIDDESQSDSDTEMTLDGSGWASGEESYV